MCTESTRAAPTTPRPASLRWRPGADRLGPRSAPKDAVGGDAGEGHGEHGRGQVGHRELARRGRSGCPSRWRHCDERVSIALRYRAAADDRDANGGRKQHDLQRGRRGQEVAAVLRESRLRSFLQRQRRTRMTRWTPRTRPRRSPACPPTRSRAATTLPVMFATKTCPSSR